MADRVDSQTRSRIMRANKRSGTKPEERMAQALRYLGIRHHRDAKMPGHPDFLFPDARLALFIHGCFWHCCPQHFRMPKTRTAEWQAHFAANRRRDRQAKRELRRRGWRPLVVWEHEELAEAVRRVQAEVHRPLDRWRRPLARHAGRGAANRQPDLFTVAEQAEPPVGPPAAAGGGGDLRNS